MKPIIELSRPVVVDRTVVPKIFALLEGRLQTSDQEVQCLKRINQSLKDEVTMLQNEHAFSYGFEDESDMEIDQAADQVASVGGGSQGAGNKGGYDGGGPSSVATGGGTTTSTLVGGKEKPGKKCKAKHHNGTTGSYGKNKRCTCKKTYRGKESSHGKEAADAEGKRKKLRIRVMQGGGAAFQVMVEPRMLDTYPEMVIYPHADAPKIVFKNGVPVYK